ncbi:MAG: hypothetical protein ABR880_23575 [Candidatus Sulfotelmatobacter sp.]
MEHVIQVELRTDTTHTLTWLDAALKPRPGMVLVCKDDPRLWTVVHAYAITAQETKDIYTDWKLGSDAASFSRKEKEAHKRTSRNVDVICLTD